MWLRRLRRATRCAAANSEHGLCLVSSALSLLLEMSQGTPLRRSTRGQPVPTRAPLQSSGSADTPSDEPVFEREATLSDLYEEERDNEDLDLSICRTLYYAQFTRRNVVAVRRAVRVYGRANKAKGKERVFGDEAAEIFEVGDAVSVRTMSRQASIAVIVAVLAVAAEGGTDEKGCRVLVHWFNRPSELPAVRARREYEENEIYYSLTSTALLPPSNIISRCSISSSRAGPSSTKRKPVYVHEETEKSVFYCASAVDPRRGLFYALDWDGFRQDALKRDGVRSGSVDAWNVVVADEEPTGKKDVTKKRTRVRPSRRTSDGSDDEAADRLLKRRVRETEEESDAGDSSFDVALNDQHTSEEDIGEDELEERFVPTTPRKRKR
ncbi:hypothetical protein EVJ58_g7313, partial [Rhodofomes roseus]